MGQRSLRRANSTTTSEDGFDVCLKYTIFGVILIATNIVRASVGVRLKPGPQKTV
jgi:hypothetical protein